MKIHNHTTPKAIRRHSICLWLATAITMAATLAALTGCSADNDPENPTGDDGTSVIFGATIDSRNTHDNAPASRAITDGTFEDGNQMLVRIDGELKVFTYSKANGGFLHNPEATEVIGIDPTPPRWREGETEKDVLAYGPTSSVVYHMFQGYLYQTTININQEDDFSYENSDYVYSNQRLERLNPALTFRHGMARVVVRLRSDGSLKDEDVAGATVLLGDKNLLIVADINPDTGTLTAHKPEPNELQPQTITPHRCADTPTGFAVAYEALLPPQDVSGKPFIKVRLSNGKELGYAAESGSSLKGGHEYVYNVTVNAVRQLSARNISYSITRHVHRPTSQTTE